MSKARSMYAVGALVKVAVGVDATVNFVRIGGGLQVCYLVSWWADGKRNEEWVPDFEVLGAPDGPTLSVREM